MGQDDIRLKEAHAKPIADVVDLLRVGGLKRAGAELVGPCPRPGCGGNDRFSVNTRKNVFNCRTCGAAGDQVALVQLVLGMGFPDALGWLCGPKPELTAAELAQREKAAQENAERRAREDNAFRAKAIADARRIWEEGVPAEGTAVRAYLERRGITAQLLPALPVCIRLHPARPYMIGEGNGWRELHRGPAMLAAIQGPDGKFCGVLQTWIDLDQPKGKLKLRDPAKPDDFLPAKKIHGSKKGGAIRLRPKPLSGQGLVVGEGIETTFSALVADLSGSAFWSGVDLGNMSGQRMLGKGQKYAGIPDLTDEDAFVPPGWVRQLLFIQDGDSEPRLTRAKLLAGCRRAIAKVPGLTAGIVPVPVGQDLNDVLMGAAAPLGETTNGEGSDL